MVELDLCAKSILTRETSMYVCAWAILSEQTRNASHSFCVGLTGIRLLLSCNHGPRTCLSRVSAKLALILLRRSVHFRTVRRLKDANILRFLLHFLNIGQPGLWGGVPNERSGHFRRPSQGALQHINWLFPHTHSPVRKQQ